MKAPLIVAGIVFAIVAILHLLRLYYAVPILVGNTPIPLWVNGIGLIVAGLLSFWMFTAACCSARCYK